MSLDICLKVHIILMTLFYVCIIINSVLVPCMYTKSNVSLEIMIHNVHAYAVK